MTHDRFERQGENPLSWVEKNFRLLLDAAPDAMLIVDSAGKIVVSNGQAEALFGIGRTQLNGMAVEELIPARFRERHPQHRQSFAMDAATRPMGAGLDLSARRSDGTEFPVEISLSPLSTDSGLFVITAIRDITERKKTEQEVRALNRDLRAKIEELAAANRELDALRLAEAEAHKAEKIQVEHKLRHSEEHFRTSIERAPYGIYHSDLDGNVLWANAALLQMLGYDAQEEILCLNTGRDFYVDQAERMRALSEWESGPAVTGFETKWKRKDGKPITVRVAGRRNPGGDGSNVGYEVFVENVTDQRNLERQFQQAQRMEAVGRLAGGVAHDFNNLLMVIGSSVQMLQNAKGDSAKIDLYASLVRGAADKASVVTRRLLAFSRQQVLQPVILLLNDVVNDIGRLLPRLLGEDIEVVLGLDKDLKNIYGDRGELEQALMNLAVNARDAMPDGGKLTIETANVELDTQYSKKRAMDVAAGRYVMLAISDTGVGMSQEVQAQIFEPFFTTKEVGKGTGLGLASVYGTVKQSGGFIWVYSEIGKGTTFKLYFPMIEVAGEAAASSARVNSYLGGAEQILLVEDEPTLRAITSAFLQEKGYRVLEATNGIEALELCKSHHGISLLVTDVVMPGLGGPSLAEAATKLLPTLKVIFMSGYTDRALDEKKITPETEFLQKPFSLDTLARVARKLLDRK